jgi:hypothetical protein
MHMTNQQLSYSIYVNKCENYGVKPLDFKQFIGKLSHEQLKLYLDYAKK